MVDFNRFLKQVGDNMQKSVDHTLRQFGTLHTGKASPQMLENVVIEVYGSNMRLKDIASITTPDARTLKVQPWDKSNLKAIEKGILIANLGIHATIFGEFVHCPLPELSRERRQELAKVAGGMAEEGKVSVRGCRRDAMEMVKAEKKAGTCTEDDVKKLEKEIQKLTDKYIESIEKILEDKTKELTTM
jgi:ribosome recycling factor